MNTVKKAIGNWDNVHLEALLATAWVLWGGLAPSYQLLGWLMYLDMVVATLAAIAQGKFSFRESILGVVRKFAMICVVIACDKGGAQLGPDFPAGRTIACLLNVHELLSIISHAGETGVWLPRPLLDAMRSLRQQIDKEPHGRSQSPTNL